MTDLAVLDATAQAELVRNGDASATELVDAAIARIEKLNGEVNAVIHPLFDRARALVQSGVPQGPFSGVPIVIKDLDGTLAGAPYHAGSTSLRRPATSSRSSSGPGSSSSARPTRRSSA
jgi:amidase